MTETTPAEQAERRTRYASAMARRDGDTWPTAYESDEADYLRRADAAIVVADAEQAEMRERHKAGLRRADRINNELMEEVQRYAEGKERPVLWSVYNAMHRRADSAESTVARVRRLHDRLATETELASPDDRITRADAAERIAAALDMRPASGPGRADGEPQQDECSASRSGHCLREAESETACDTEAGECVHGGKPGGEVQQDETQAFTIQVWPLARVLTEARCGSEDWTWDEEWADLDRRHAESGYLAKLEQDIRANGITMPVLIGTDGRIWDGHHRLRIAVRAGIGYVPVEVPAAVSQPGKEA